MIFDARPNGNDWHAGFDQIEPWLEPGRYLIGHGVDDISSYPDLPLLKPGQQLALETDR